MNLIQTRNQRRILKATFFINVALSIIVTGIVAPAFALVLGMAPDGLVSKMYDLNVAILLYYCAGVFALTCIFYFIGSQHLRNYE